MKWRNVATREPMRNSSLNECDELYSSSCSLCGREIDRSGLRGRSEYGNN